VSAPGDPIVVAVADAAAMRAAGERLGRALAVGDVIGLVGPLGAGKTTFVQGVARGTGVPADRHVASPTFTLVNEHPGRVPLVHVDFYRISDPREVPELGLHDAFDRAAVAIEWIDRFPDAAPAERLEIEIAFADHGARRLTAVGYGPRAQALAAALEGPAR
jgi:tRNA threonylcarbamoyladenosine biosynthesis protein TsaE